MSTAAMNFSQSQVIPEMSTRKYKATLRDQDAQPLAVPAVTSIKFSLRDDKSGVIINARNRIEVLNQNGGTFSANGAFEMVLNSSDLVTLGTSKIQKRRALFEVTYTTGLENHEVYFFIENLKDLPQTVVTFSATLLGIQGLPLTVKIN